MDEFSVLELHQKIPKQMIKHKKIKFCEDLFLSRGGIGWLGRGIVFNINVLRAGLEKRAGSSVQVKLDGAEVHLREVFNSIHPEIFKTRCIIAIQQVCKCFGRFELRNGIFLSLRGEVLNSSFFF